MNFDKVSRSTVLQGWVMRQQPVAFSNAEDLYDDLILLRDELNSYGNLSDSIVDYLNDFIDKFDNNLYKTSEEILNKWLRDGILSELVEESLLKQYVSKKYFDEVMSDINYGIVDNLETSQELYIKYPTGTKGIVLVTNESGGKDFWYFNETWVNGGIFNNLVLNDNSVTRKKLNFKTPYMINTYNLFNEDEIQDNTYYSVTDGSKGVNNEYFSIPIKVEQNTNYKMNLIPNGYSRIDVINLSSTGTFLGSENITNTGVWLTPPLATKSILTIYKPILPNNMVYKGTVYKSFIPDRVMNASQVTGLEKELKNKLISKYKLEGDIPELDHSVNIIDNVNTIKGYYINYQTGELITNADYQSFYITLKSKKIYHNINYQFCLYDNNGNYIIGFDGTQRFYDLTQYTNAVTLGSAFKTIDKDKYIMAYSEKLTMFRPSVDLVKQKNIENESLSIKSLREKVVTGKPSYNIYDEEDVIKGYVALQNGGISPTTGFGYTLTRNLKEGQEISFSNGSSQGAFYNDKYEFISGYLSKNIVTVPEGATILASTHYLEPAQPNQMYLGKVPLNRPKNEVYINPETIEDRTIEKEKLNFPVPIFNESENLYNPQQAVEGKYIAESGAIGTNPEYSYQVIKLDKTKTKLCFNHAYQGHFYDENMVSLSGWANGNTSVIIPEKAIYAGVTIYNSWNDTMISYENVKPYSPYKVTMNAEYISNFEQIERIITVGKNGIYKTINEAVSTITGSENVLIVILSGVYNENVDLRNKNVTLWGYDKENTIIQNKLNDYERPPLNLSGSNNGVYNLTVKALKSDDGSQGTFTPYAIHIDAVGLTQNNEKTIVSNCNVYSETNAAIGIGTRNKQTVRIEKSRLESGAEGYQALYAHNYQLSGAENEKLEFVDLELINNRTGVSTVVIQDANYRNGGSADNKKDTTVFFKGCSSYNYATSDKNDVTVDTPLDENSFSGYIKLIPYSYGNLASKLNG